MTSHDRARIERALLMARMQLRRASYEFELQVELETLVPDVAAAWEMVDFLCTAFSCTDRDFLRTRPHEHTIDQRTSGSIKFGPKRAPNRKPRQPRPARPERDVQEQLRNDRRARRASTRDFPSTE